MDAVSFQDAVRDLDVPYPGAKNAPIYPFNPTIDHDFIQDYTYNEFKNGHFVKVPIIIGDSTNEGLIFTTKAVSSLQKAYTFVADQFPNLDAQDQEAIEGVWQGPTDESYDGRWRNVAADIYGHIRYICPGLNFSSAYADSTSVNTWQYRWDVAQRDASLAGFRTTVLDLVHPIVRPEPVHDELLDGWWDQDDKPELGDVWQDGQWQEVVVWRR
jgi:carboxylesterase type B